MPLSVANPPKVPGQRLAVAAEALYLINLLLPVVFGRKQQPACFAGVDPPEREG